VALNINSEDAVLYFDWVISCRDCDFSQFLSVPPDKCRKSISTGHQRLSSTSSPICYQLIIVPFSLRKTSYGQLRKTTPNGQHGYVFNRVATVTFLPRPSVRVRKQSREEQGCRGNELWGILHNMCCHLLRTF
jgi:hypothetical protein